MLRKIILSSWSILGFGLLCVVGAAVWQFVVLASLKVPMNTSMQALFYDFKAGSNLNTLTKDLATLGVLKHPEYLRLYVKLQDNATNLKSGVYRIAPKSQSALDLLALLQKGGVAQFSFRAEEGKTVQNMLDKISENKDLKHTQIQWQPESIMAAIGKQGIPYEGQFFPDTYRLPYGFSDVDFFKKSYETMQIILSEEWLVRDKNVKLKNKYEALILASIIEKETSNDAERFMVSGVFHNRLRKKMRLQTDPTVIYGMGSLYKGNLTKKDLRTKTAYNTYKIKGLPPTPISMPGRKAIHAALHPAKTKALFFVAKGGNRHYFSATYAEHKRAVRKYQIEPYKKRVLARKLEAKKLKQSTEKPKASKANEK